MRAADLDLRELFDFDPKGGVHRFAGQRTLLLDAVALGLLRRSLVETIGLSGARGVLTRLGYALGWRTASAMRGQFHWDSEAEWRIAGGRLHRLQGMVTFEPVPYDGEGPEPFAHAIWRDSYEAEQHVLHLGQADDPVCWTSCGYASGYLSRSNGREIRCVEESCRGQGDLQCRMVGRGIEEWGDRAATIRADYEDACLEASLSQVTEHLKRTERKLASRRKELAAPPLAGPIAVSPPMRAAMNLAGRVARVDSTVLLIAESGAGKEVLARFIHDHSLRAGEVYHAINCAAVPETLLESELFGHARGAFTGATQDRAGLFEAASGSTLFLDEVGDVPLAMQAKLLRVLEQREVRRLGETKDRSVDVRVIAATNRDLAADVDSGRFRRDLYYRLRVIELTIPPLRERTEDLLPLARSFVEEAAARLGSKVTGLSPAAADALARHDWPGNVRELKNAIERAVVLAEGRRIALEDLPSEVRQASSPAGGSPTLAEVERRAILAALEEAGGNKAKAAGTLGIGTATLFRKLKRYSEG